MLIARVNSVWGKFKLCQRPVGSLPDKLGN